MRRYLNELVYDTDQASFVGDYRHHLQNSGKLYKTHYGRFFITVCPEMHPEVIQAVNNKEAKTIMLQIDPNVTPEKWKELFNEEPEYA